MQREAHLTAIEAETALASFSRLLTQIVSHPLDPPIFTLSRTLLAQYPLRAMDALQLATAVFADHSSQENDFTFIASDKRLLEAAEGEKLRIWNPLTGL